MSEIRAFYQDALSSKHEQCEALQAEVTQLSEVNKQLADRLAEFRAWVGGLIAVIIVLVVILWVGGLIAGRLR